MSVHVFRRSAHRNDWREVTHGVPECDHKVLDWCDGSVDSISRRFAKRRYEKFMRRMPLCCVDTVIIRGDSMLLTPCHQEVQDQKWWIQGGPLRKGEGLETAATRTAKETGLQVELLGLLGVFSMMFDFTAQAKAKAHTINVTLLGSVSDRSVAEPTNSAYTDYTWWPLDKSTGSPYLDHLAALARSHLDWR